MAQIDLTVFAPAKINLTLHVIGKRGDGYHELESLVVFADVGDRVSAVRSDYWQLLTDGPFAHDLAGLDPNDNLIFKASQLVQEWAEAKKVKIPALRFHLEKNLPIASGIGGGSSDAAAAIKLCLQAAGQHMDDDLMRAAARLGADVPVCLLGRPAWMSGIGEHLEPVEVPADLPMVLINPGVAVSTAEVFRRLNAGQVENRQASTPTAFKSAGQVADFVSRLGNDLQAPAAEIVPVINDVLSSLRDTGCLTASMSGSGATCFGIYESADAANDAAAQLSAGHADWWVSF